MKLHILSRYDRLGASSRVRTMQYVPHLEAAGFGITVSPLFDAGYLEALYEGRRTAPGLPRYLARRLRALRAAGSADVIWVEKEALPWMPWAIEGRLLPARVPLVSDHDDALFHRYDQNPNPLVRRTLGRKIDRVMARSNIVFAGNRYIAGRAESAGAPRIELVPTVVDLDAYRPKAEPAQDDRVGWIGSPSTWPLVEPLIPLLREVAREFGRPTLVVGAGPGAGPSEGFEFVDWSEQREVELIRRMGVGIMHLGDTPWERGKCGYKLIQYMACGLPVVASPVGVNRQIVEPGVNGFLARTDADWHAALTTLLRDPELRRRMGAAGRRKVEAEYSIQRWGPKVAGIMAALARDRRRDA